MAVKLNLTAYLVQSMPIQIVEKEKETVLIDGLISVNQFKMTFVK